MGGGWGRNLWPLLTSHLHSLNYKGRKIISLFTKPVEALTLPVKKKKKFFLNFIYSKSELCQGYLNVIVKLSLCRSQNNIF